MTQATLAARPKFDVGYYESHRRAGLDYLAHGDWQASYGRWLVEVFGLQGRPVLDGGCAAGSIAFGLHKAGARVRGVDLNEYLIQRGRAAFAVPLAVCDLVNLHLFGDAAFSLVHTNQVAEYWRPELVPFILAELGRVLKPGGLVWLVLDTTDLYLRQGRDSAAPGTGPAVPGAAGVVAG